MRALRVSLQEADTQKTALYTPLLDRLALLLPAWKVGILTFAMGISRLYILGGWIVDAGPAAWRKRNTTSPEAHWGADRAPHAVDWSAQESKAGQVAGPGGPAVPQTAAVQLEASDSD